VKFLVFRIMPERESGILKLCLPIMIYYFVRATIFNAVLSICFIANCFYFVIYCVILQDKFTVPLYFCDQKYLVTKSCYCHTRKAYCKIVLVIRNILLMTEFDQKCCHSYIKSLHIGNVV